MQFTVFPVFPERKLAGPSPTRDRLPGIEPCSLRDGLNGDKRHPLRDADHGVEPCSSGVCVDAGHHIMLAPFRKVAIGIAIIVQEVKVSTNPAIQDLNPSVQLSPSAQDIALTFHAAAGTASPPAASSRPGAVARRQQRRGGLDHLRLDAVASPDVSRGCAVAVDAAFVHRVTLSLLTHGYRQVCAGVDFRCDALA